MKLGEIFCASSPPDSVITPPAVKRRFDRSSSSGPTRPLNASVDEVKMKLNHNQHQHQPCPQPESPSKKPNLSQVSVPSPLPANGRQRRWRRRRPVRAQVLISPLPLRAEWCAIARRRFHAMVAESLSP